LKRQGDSFVDMLNLKKESTGRVRKGARKRGRKGDPLNVGWQGNTTFCSNVWKEKTKK